MAKIELNEKKQIKANVFFKRLKEIKTYKAALEKKQESAKAEIGDLQAQLQTLNVEYFTVIDEISANAINTKRRVIKDRITDLEMILQMDIKGIIRQTLFNDPELKTLKENSRIEYNQFKDEMDMAIKELEAEIKKLEELQKQHIHLAAGRDWMILVDIIRR
jgi:hypothetical protein